MPDEPVHRALYVTDLEGKPLFYSPDVVIEPVVPTPVVPTPVVPTPSLEDRLTDEIDAYLMENYGYLSGNKEDGYTIDGYIGPRFLAQRLVTIIEKEKNA